MPKGYGIKCPQCFCVPNIGVRVGTKHERPPKPGRGGTGATGFGTGWRIPPQH